MRMRLLIWRHFYNFPIEQLTLTTFQYASLNHPMVLIDRPFGSHHG
jgi:hypothetical protein